MSRTKAKKVYTVQHQMKATEGVACRKNANVIDKIPFIWKLLLFL
jgi:tRNA-splicing ligase RtcB